VTRGQRAIHINAPLPVKRRDRDTGEKTDETITLFKTVAVFAQDQVAPLPDVEPTPLEPPCQPLTGDSHARLLAPLTRFAESLGYTVTLKPLSGSARGYCDPDDKQIVVDTQAPPNAQLRTLIHETAHALGVHYTGYGRERAEVIVDTVTHLVAGSVGLDVSGESIAYIAGWGEDGALEAVTTFANTIDELARQIEHAIAADRVTLQAR
jgi:hypothetical protein